MILSNAHKALLATFAFSGSIVLMAFSVHIKKIQTQQAETYYEILPEELIEEETAETLEDILKSFDAIETNKAFNENTTSNELEDEQFEELMERINNRHSETTPEEKAIETTTETTNENPEAFDKINEIIKKTSSNESNNENSSISYSLVGRTKDYIPPPIYLCEEGGKIVISIVVNSKGEVLETYFNNASTSNNGCLIDAALEYAKASKFSSNPDRETQLGTITFLFKRKH